MHVEQRTLDKQGVAIIVAPSLGNLWPASGQAVVDVDVPGSPPLWVNNKAKELAWRADLIKRVTKENPPSVNRFTADFQFRIEPEKMQSADIDNYVVPAAQSTTVAMLRSVYLGTKLTALSATKCVAGPDRPIGTRVRVWSDDGAG